MWSGWGLSEMVVILAWNSYRLFQNCFIDQLLQNYFQDEIFFINFTEIDK